jgi:hypothetical protein
MKKLLLLILIGALILRVSDALPGMPARLDPVLEHMAAGAGPRLRPLLDAPLRWSVRQELRTLARDLKKREASMEQLPHPYRFQAYIQQSHLSGRGGTDPWGGEYYLVVTLDSVVVASPGPDGVRDTDEDIRLGWQRQRAGPDNGDWLQTNRIQRTLTGTVARPGQSTLRR